MKKIIKICVLMALAVLLVFGAMGCEKKPERHSTRCADHKEVITIIRANGNISEHGKVDFEPIEYELTDTGIIIYATSGGQSFRYEYRNVSVIISSYPLDYNFWG